MEKKKKVYALRYKILVFSLISIKRNLTFFATCDNQSKTFATLPHRATYQRDWDRHVPGAESFPKNVGELKG